MLRKLMLALLMTTAAPVLAGNFYITIDGKRHEVALDQSTQIKIGNQTFDVMLEQKAVLKFDSQSFSFEHPKEYTPGKSELDSQIHQTSVMTPLGTVVLVQEYFSLNPEGLIDLMVNEVTKEERQYGYKISEEAHVITLADGKTIKGKRVYSKYPGSNIERFIGAWGKGDAGILVMSQIDYDIDKDADNFLKVVFDSMVIK